MESAPWLSLLDLASARLGGLTLAASDDFFAEKENLLQPGAAQYKDGVYTDRGKWMDGWESRRNRDPSKHHDWVVVRLGLPGRLAGFDVDTSFFVGNAPEHAAVDALATPDGRPLRPHEVASLPESAWTEVLPKTAVERGAHNFLALTAEQAARVPRATHVRLRIFPDGGVARFARTARWCPTGRTPCPASSSTSPAWPGAGARWPATTPSSRPRTTSTCRGRRAA
ncbi:MAG: hypothetical protein U1F43_10635 [Myxococcota bacterium]